MITIVKQVSAEIELHGKDIANMFCQLDEREQAEFFNAIAKEVKSWDGTFDYQMCQVSIHSKLSIDGRKIMKTIGDYSEKVKK